MDSVTERTLSSGWLGQVEPELKREFLRAAQPRMFADGSAIQGFQEEQTCLWGVGSGAVRLYVAMNEQVPKLAHVAGPGFWFGDAPVVTGQPRALQATAAGNTRLFAIDRAVIANVALRNPDAWLAVAKLVLMNELTAIGAGEDLMIRDSRARLVAVLLRLSGRRNAFQGVAPIATVPVTQHELAEASCLSRSSAALILKDLVARGMIRTVYGSITILDAKALESVLFE
ncbi:Crp/Fnr family transcriptional regulator [Tropicimonas aquimaris]|uniref:Crp/Fnr family transcriptional regulator n=1 Tax=Tropicimonas aquimaris TaxID=914152 RepID=A0ABW3IQY5_9RHOB